MAFLTSSHLVEKKSLFFFDKSHQMILGEMRSFAAAVPVEDGETGEFNRVDSLEVNSCDVFHVFSAALVRLS